MSLSKCLSFERLEQIAEGDLPAEAEELHLQECEVCFNHLEEIRQCEALLLSFQKEERKKPTLAFGFYANCRRIAEGGMSVVYTAHDAEGEMVVIKACKSPELLPFFKNEISMLEKCAQEEISGVITLLDYDLNHQPAYLVLPYIKGGDLSGHLRQFDKLKPERVVRVASGLVSIFSAFAKAGLVHGDLKPSNLMLDENGQVILTDLGTSREFTRESKDYTQVNALSVDKSATVAYMSPEVVLGRPATSASDVFALGTLLYELLSGRHPFEGATPWELASNILRANVAPLGDEVPNGLKSLIYCCLQKSPEARPDFSKLPSLSENELKSTKYLKNSQFCVRKWSDTSILHEHVTKYKMSKTWRIIMIASLLLGATLTVGSLTASQAAPNGSSTVLATKDHTWRQDIEKNLMKTDQTKSRLEAGKITAVYFSAKWCGPCQEFTPHLVRFAETNNELFQAVFVSLDDTEEEQVSYMKKSGMTFPTISCQSKFIKTLALQAQYEGGIPHLSVFDPDGKLITTEGRDLIQFAQEFPDFGKETSKAAFEVWKYMISIRQTVVREISNSKEAERLKKQARFWKMFDLTFPGGPVEKSVKYWYKNSKYLSDDSELTSDDVLKRYSDWTLKDYQKLIKIYEFSYDYYVKNSSVGLGLIIHYDCIPLVAEKVAKSVDDSELLKLLNQSRVLKDPTTYSAHALLWLLGQRMVHTKNQKLKDYFWKVYTDKAEDYYDLMNYLLPLAQQGDEMAYKELERWAAASGLTYLLEESVIDKISGNEEQVGRIRKIIAETRNKRKKDE